MLEDAGVPSGAVGSLVSAYTGGITEPDGSATRGIAIVSSNETNGTWYYSTNAGASWTAVGTVSSAQSLLLADNASTRLYFAPNANYNGSSASALTIRAWDQTSGAAGTKVSTATSGGTTAFSSATDVIDVSVTSVNDAPTLTATGSNPTFTEDGSSVSLFSGAAASTIEGGQTITSLTLTVSNLANGAAERLTADGTTFNLTNGATGTTATNGMTYSVSVVGSTATVTLTKGAGISTAATQSVINGLAYDNNSQAPTEGTRTVTLTQVVDSGPGGAPDVNTSALSIASTVTVQGVPEAPTISAVPENAGGGINAAEASDGTTVTVALPTDAVAGDTLRVNWGGQTISYTITAGDVSGGSAAVSISSAAITTQGEGSVNVTADVTHAGRTGALSGAFAVTVDLTAPVPTISADLEHHGRRRHQRRRSRRQRRDHRHGRRRRRERRHGHAERERHELHRHGRGRRVLDQRPGRAAGGRCGLHHPGASVSTSDAAGNVGTGTRHRDLHGRRDGAGADGHADLEHHGRRRDQRRGSRRAPSRLPARSAATPRTATPSR